MTITIVKGNILDSKEKYIAHQTNCTMTGEAGGVARVIFNAYPYSDIYKDKTERKTGEIIVRGDGKKNRYVINMNAQKYPGGIVSTNEIDGAKDRVKWFAMCLDNITKIHDLESIAFPYCIGCGIAGGDWKIYYAMLEEFDKRVDARVVLYKID